MLPEFTVLFSNRRHDFIWLLPNRSSNRVSNIRCQREDKKQCLSLGAEHSSSFPSLKMGLCIGKEECQGEEHTLIKQTKRMNVYMI